MFVQSDAFTLSGIIRKEKPRRIVEAGSGFSSAVMLDTLEQTHASAALTFIEPYPDRLYSLLSDRDRSSATILVQRIQEIPLSVFNQLEAQDVLFIDSSHVAKIGSDVTFILLRVLPSGPACWCISTTSSTHSPTPRVGFAKAGRGMNRCS